MAEKIDMSLDDIIRSKRGTRGRGRGRGRMQRGRGRRFIPSQTNRRPQRNMRGSDNIEGQWQHDMYYTRSNQPTNMVSSNDAMPLSAGGPGKLLISNLDFGVSDSDIQELFGEFGALLSAAVHYDRTGRSLGTADVIFERKMDAIQGIRKYNNVPLDGRPMNIQLATSDISLSNMSNGVSRPNPIGRRLTGNSGGNTYRRGGFGGNFGRGGGRFRGGNFRRGGRGRGGGPKPTIADLDAELDTYKSQMEIA